MVGLGELASRGVGRPSPVDGDKLVIGTKDDGANCPGNHKNPEASSAAEASAGEPRP